VNAKRLLCWAAVFCALGAYVLLFERGPTPQAPEQTAPRLFSCTAAQIREIAVTREGRTLRLALRNGVWETDPPCGDRITQDHLQSFVNALLDITQIEEVARLPASLDQFGLTKPWARVRMLLQDQERPVELLLGAVAPSQVSMYAQRADDDRIILIGTYLSFSLKTLMNAAAVK